ncbi:MAG: large repetitive protein [Acidobacteriota bacterium]|jgi:hypothetical protein|nr:large repetitive protein [Acidobacteriota bacterium]
MLYKWIAAGTLTAFLLLPALARGATPLPSGTEIHVNASTHGLHFDPSAAVFPDGGFVVVWTNGPASGGRTVIHARLFAANGAPASGEFRLTDPAPGSQHADQVAADRDGSFLVAWSEERAPGGPADVYVRRFRRDGTPAQAQVRVNVDRTFSSSRARLAIGADRRFAVAWSQEEFRDFPYRNAMARRFQADGTPVGDGFIVGYGDPGIGDDTTDIVPTGVALAADGALSVLYEARSLIGETQMFLKRYSPRGGESAYLHLSDFDHVSFNGSSLAMTPDGGLVAVWNEEYEISGARLTPRAVRRGDPFPVDLRYVGNQGTPKVAALPDGGFVTVWAEADRDGNGQGVYGRAFAADGTPASRDLRINVTIAGDQASPDVAANLRGPVVVVWRQGATDIYARLLTPR